MSYIKNEIPKEYYIDTITEPFLNRETNAGFVQIDRVEGSVEQWGNRSPHARK